MNSSCSLVSAITNTLHLRDKAIEIAAWLTLLLLLTNTNTFLVSDNCPLYVKA